MKVADIKPDALRAGQQAAMRQDIDWLAARRDRFEVVPCPACESGRRQPLYDKNGVPHVCCLDCGTQYASPRPGEALLAEFYATSANYAYWAKYMFPASEASRRENIFRPRAETAAGLARDKGIEGGTLLEVGAGWGMFCEELASTGAFGRIIGIEPTPDLAEKCRQRGIETIEAPWEQAELGTVVDMVTAFEVIEHLFDPARFLAWVLEALRPGGFVLLTCPNCRGFDTLVLGRDADAVDHEHINLFHPASIRMLAERVGFVDVEVSTPGQLDFDIVQRAYHESRIGPEQLGPFLSALLVDDAPGIGDRFQAFLQQANMSSNMMLVGRRPAA